MLEECAFTALTYPAPCLHNWYRFLLARLHMDSLVAKLSTAAARKALLNLPKEVNGTYDEAFTRIERQSEEERDLAKQILTWVTLAVRPLSTIELQHALAVVPGVAEFDTDDIVDVEILLSVCAGLVVLEEKTKLVKLVRK